MEETVKYQHRFEEGYDIPDPRYEHWLALYHPEANMPSKNSSGPPPPHQRSMVHLPQTSLSKFLRISTPKHKLPAKEPKNSARILTSAESRRILEEKQKKKEQEAVRKEERMKAREKAKLMKAVEAQMKELRKEKGKGSSYGTCTLLTIQHVLEY